MVAAVVVTESWSTLARSRTRSDSALLVNIHGADDNEVRGKGSDDGHRRRWRPALAIERQLLFAGARLPPTPKGTRRSTAQPVQGSSHRAARHGSDQGLLTAAPPADPGSKRFIGLIIPSTSDWSIQSGFTATRAKRLVCRLRRRGCKEPGDRALPEPVSPAKMTKGRVLAATYSRRTSSSL